MLGKTREIRRERTSPRFKLITVKEECSQMQRSQNKICVMSFPNYPTYETGRGMDKYTYELFRHLKRSSPNLCLLEGGIVKSSLDFLMWAPSFHFRLIKTDARVYHALSEYSAAFAILAKKHPLITTLHDVIPLYFFSKKPFTFSYQLLSAKLVKSSDRIIATSSSTKRQIIHNLSIPEEKIEIIHYGVDHERFRPFSKEDSRKEKIIFYIGQVSRLKGIFALLKGYHIFLKTGKLANVKLLIGGEGKDYHLVKNLVSSRQFGRKITLLGFVEEEQLPYYYNLADVFVWPSYLGFGLSILEAMACGVPVIAGNSFDTPEYVGDAGTLYNTSEPTQLAKEILNVLTNDDLRNEMSRKALEHSRKFSWEDTAIKTKKLYSEFAADV